MNNRGVDDRAGRNLQPVRFEMPMDLFEQTTAEIMRLEQMPEAADRRLVGRRLAAEIDPGEITHRRRVVERLLDAGVGEIEPLLKKINPKHPVEAIGRPAVPRLWIERLNQRAYVRPWNNLLHLGKKRGTPRRLAVAIKPFRGKRQLLHRPFPSVSHTNLAVM